MTGISPSNLYVVDYFEYGLNVGYPLGGLKGGFSESGIYLPIFIGDIRLHSSFLDPESGIDL